MNGMACVLYVGFVSIQFNGTPKVFRLLRPSSKSRHQKRQKKSDELN